MKNELERIENELFKLEMKDRWTNRDYERQFELVKRKYEILRGEA